MGNTIDVTIPVDPRAEGEIAREIPDGEALVVLSHVGLSLDRELARSQREAHNTAILLCDIDHFKSVNDTYGHPAGDEVLREVARRLLSSVRSYDFAGRYGGEEFLLVLNNCDSVALR